MAEVRPKVGRWPLWAQMALYVAAVVILGLGTEVLTDSGTTAAPGGGTGGRWPVAVTGIAVAPLFYRFFERRSPLEMGLRMTGFGRWMAGGALWGAAGVALSVSILWMVGWLSWPRGFAGASPIRGIFVCLVFALWEELVFRGYLLSAIRNRFDLRTAVVGTSLLYALYGAMESPRPLFVCNTFLLGMLLAQSRERAESLGWAVGFHWMWRVFQGPLFGVDGMSNVGPPVVWHGPVWLYPGETGLAGGAVVTAMLIVCQGLFHNLWSRRSS